MQPQQWQRSAEAAVHNRSTAAGWLRIVYRVDGPLWPAAQVVATAAAASRSAAVHATVCHDVCECSHEHAGLTK